MLVGIALLTVGVLAATKKRHSRSALSRPSLVLRSVRSTLSGQENQGKQLLYDKLSKLAHGYFFC